MHGVLSRMVRFVPWCLIGLLGGCGNQSDVDTIPLTQVQTDQATASVQTHIASYQQRVLADPNDAQLVGELGIAFELHGYSEEALSAYDAAARLEPTAMRWRYYQAILLAARYNLTEALVKIDEALALDPTYGPGWIQRGELLFEDSQFEAALASYQRAHELTDDEYALIGQSLAYLQLEQPQQTLEVLDRLVKLGQHAHVVRLRGSALIQLGRSTEAAAILEGLPLASRLRWQDPLAEEKNFHAAENLSSLSNEISTLMRNGAYESAKFLIEDVLETHPRNKHLLNNLGEVHDQLGEVEQAVSTYLTAIHLHPGYYPLRTNVARAMAKVGDLDGAYEHLDAAIAIDPELSWAYSQKALLLMENREWLEASTLLDRALSIKPEDADLYTYLGICMGFMNRWPEAANLYKVAISLNERHIPSYVHLARAETILGNEEEALLAIESARQFGASTDVISNLERQRDQIKRMQIQVSVEG